MAVTVYQNTDTSAPVLSRTAGSMIALLDAILVNGYGSKPAAGWTKVYHTGDVAVFRNSTAPGSTGMHLRVDDSNIDYASVCCFKTMSDINTGTDPIPSFNLNAQTFLFWPKHYTQGTTPKQWAAIADERTIYLNVNIYNSFPSSLPSDGYGMQLYGAGDYISYVPGNEWNYMVFGHPTSAGTSSILFPDTVGSSGSRPFFIGRSQLLEPEINSYASALCLWGSPGHSSTQPAFSIYTGLRHYMPAEIIEYWNGTVNTGRMRGGYWACFRGTAMWFEDMGKLPGDPTGPNMRRMCTHPQTSYTSMIVREGAW